MNRQNVSVEVLVKMLKDIMMMTPNPKAPNSLYFLWDHTFAERDNKLICDIIPTDKQTVAHSV